MSTAELKAIQAARNTGMPFSFAGVDALLNERLKHVTLATPEERARLEPYNPHKSPQKSKAGPPPKPRKGGSRRRGNRKGRKTRSNRG